MTPISVARLAGAAAIALALSLGAPAFAFNTSDESSTPPPPVKHSTATPTLADANADIKANNWTKAISDLKAFLKANPKNPDGWNLLGFSYRNHGDLKLADGAYDRALALDPNHTGALSYQGILYVKMGKADEAKANLAKIEKICGNTTCPEYAALAAALG